MSGNIPIYSDEDFGRGLPLFDEPVSDELAVEKRTSWTGPLPPPDKLKEYNEAIPDGADRIFKMTEKQAEHRMDMEKKLITEEQRQSRMGQNFAFIISLAFLAISGLLIWNGHDIAGTVLGTVDLVTLVTVFILGRKNQKK